MLVVAVSSFLERCHPQLGNSEYSLCLASRQGQLLAVFNAEKMNGDLEMLAAFCRIPTALFEILFLVFYMISLFESSPALQGKAFPLYKHENEELNGAV